MASCMQGCSGDVKDMVTDKEIRFIQKSYQQTSVGGPVDRNLNF